METIKELSNGLILRRATVEDAERLAAFNARIHGEDPFDAEAVAVWTRDLATCPPPLFSAGDYTIVEDTKTGEIVSSLNLISQQWSYEGIPFGVGRPELVGTDENYRGHGLVREQFDVVHEWSRQRGQMVQIITGIPFFYRQFGYEMCVDLGGGRAGYEAQLPKLEEGKEEDYLFRPATEADLPFIMRMYEREERRSMIRVLRDEATWRNELFEKSHGNVNRAEIRIIETRDGRPVGYLSHPWFAWGTSQVAWRYELEEGTSYLAVTPAVLRYLWKVGQENASLRGKTLNTFGLWLGTDHPAYLAVPNRVPVERKPYAFFVRVPDLPGFLNHIAPVLERRLAESPAAGHTGEVKVSFYRTGLRLVFTDGRLTVEPWKPTVADGGNAAFPNLTFLQLLFGYRALEELRYAYVDCWAHDEARVLLEALFPKRRSFIWAVC